MSVSDRRTRSFAIGLVSDSVFKDRCDPLARPGRRSVAESYEVGQDLFVSGGRARGELSTWPAGRAGVGWRNVLVVSAASRSFRFEFARACSARGEPANLARIQPVFGREHGLKGGSP